MRYKYLVFSHGTMQLTRVIYNDLVYWVKQHSGVLGNEYQNNVIKSNYYIRFGLIPKDELSTNHMNNIKLIGTSVYKVAFINLYTIPILPILKKLDITDTLKYYRFCENISVVKFVFGLQIDTNKKYKPIYIVTGDEVGIGSDGLPLLRNISIISKVKTIVKECNLCKEKLKI